MPSKTLVIRIAAIGIVMTSGGLFAVNAGLVPGTGGRASVPAPAVSAAPAQVAETIAGPAPSTLADDRAPEAGAPVLQATVAPEIAVPPRVPPAASAPASLPQAPVDLGDRMGEDPAAVAPQRPREMVSPFGLPCGLSVATEAGPAAMVVLDVMAPCTPNARLTIEHSGLTLSAATDAMGLLTVDIPAFEDPAFVTVRLEDGRSASSLVAVPDLGDYERLGVQWEGTRDLEIHAMEFGADYGELGHIWQGNPGTALRALGGEGGFVSRLGSENVSDPMLAQVYTFPRDAAPRDGTVRVSIEAEVNERNCGTDTLARTLQTRGDEPVSVIELVFRIPGCDAMGDYLVLQNLFRDLRIASN